MPYTTRLYDAEQDFDTVYALIKRNVEDSVSLLGGEWKEPDQTTFFQQTFAANPPRLIEWHDSYDVENPESNVGRIVGCYEVSVEPDNDVVVLDKFYVDWATMAEAVGNGVAMIAMTDALKQAEEHQLPLETVPLTTEYQKLNIMKLFGFGVISDEPIGYAEGTDLHDDFAWVQTSILRHVDTFKFAPDMSPIVQPGPEGYKPPQP